MAGFLLLFNISLAVTLYSVHNSRVAESFLPIETYSNYKMPLVISKIPY